MASTASSTPVLGPDPTLSPLYEQYRQSPPETELPVSTLMPELRDHQHVGFRKFSVRAPTDFQEPFHPDHMPDLSTLAVTTGSRHIDLPSQPRLIKRRPLPGQTHDPRPESLQQSYSGSTTADLSDQPYGHTPPTDRERSQSLYFNDAEPIRPNSARSSIYCVPLDFSFGYTRPDAPFELQPIDPVADNSDDTPLASVTYSSSVALTSPAPSTHSADQLRGLTPYSSYLGLDHGPRGIRPPTRSMYNGRTPSEDYQWQLSQTDTDAPEFTENRSKVGRIGNTGRRLKNWGAKKLATLGGLDR